MIMGVGVYALIGAFCMQSLESRTIAEVTNEVHRRHADKGEMGIIIIIFVI